MSPHLSSNDFGECLTGAPAPEAMKHLAECAACRMEFARLEASLGAFSSSIREWSAAESARVSPAATRRAANVRAPARWAWAFASLAITIAAGLSLTSVRHSRLEAAAARDSELLRTVQAQVTQGVPGAMAPLARLVAFENSEEESRNE